MDTKTLQTSDGIELGLEDVTFRILCCKSGLEPTDLLFIINCRLLRCIERQSRNNLHLFPKVDKELFGYTIVVHKAGFSAVT